mmetsp:Transcript_29267/g.47247  ORF Transcript_29267/g.47247 Transcript_29267/m.47247 type:complete len:227 (+) Transcript_29267:1373-2053(+)
MFPCAYENNGTLGRSNSTKGASTFGMPIKLCQNHTANIHSIVESLCLVECCLSYGAVHDKDYVIRFHRFHNLLHLLEQGPFLLVATTCINNNHFVALFFELLHSIFCNLCCVCLSIASIERNLTLGSILLKLVKCPCTERVGTDQCTFPALPLIMIGVLRHRGCFSSSLKADKHNDVRFSLFQNVRLLLAVKHRAELIVHCLLNKLPLVDTSSKLFEINVCFDVVA